MAKMYPEWIDPKDVDSPYEPALFDLFKKHLSDDYTIFYSIRLQKPRPKRLGGGVIDVEVDFVIAHLNYGLLCLEAKGGNWEVDSKTRRWRNLNDGTVLNRSPYIQSHDGCYALLEWLQSRPETQPFRYPTWWAVALPGCDVGANEEIEPGQPREILLDKSDLLEVNIAASMERIFQHYERTGGKSQLGVKGVRALELAMGRTWFLRSFMATDFEQENEQIKRLTDAQFKVLRQMESNRRMLITGVAGSGKTMLAVQKATRLADDGLNVLYTCFNVNLAEYLKIHVPRHPNLKIEHFHKFAESYADRAKVTLKRDYDDKGSLSSDFFDTVLPEGLLEAIDKSQDRFDAIIVDEGQDFKGNYWMPLQFLLRDEDSGVFYIFCDDNQRIYSQDDMPFTEPRLHLGENLRNVRPIGLMVQNYHSGKGYYEAAGPEVNARKPQIVKTSKYTDKSQALEEVLEDLAGEQIPADHIVVLTPLGRTSRWKNNMQIGRFTLVTYIQTRAPNQITVETVQSFKGLERPVVILTELDRWLPEERDEFLYIALSRARNHLIVFDELPDPKKKQV